MKKIVPFLWFSDQAEEAAKYYVSIIPESKIKRMTYYDELSAEASGRPKGSVMTVEFELFGQDFVALNGGPVFKFSPAVSFAIPCQTQEEIDFFWEKLSADGEKGQCGWINRDKFGVTWQVYPKILDEMLNDADTERAKRVMKAMLGMKKIDIATLQKAYDNK